MKKTNCVINGNQPRYRVRAKIGEDLNGKAVYKSFYGKGKVEAEKKRDEYLTKHKGIENSRTLGQLMFYYIYKVMPGEGLAAGTIELYERPFRRYIVNSKISLAQISDLRPSDLQTFLTDLTIKKSAMTTLVKILRRFFRWAYREGYANDIMYGVAPPRYPESAKIDRIAVFSDEDVSNIIRTPNRLHFAFLLALSTGLREGELLALRYSDFENGAVSVKRQLQEFYEITPDGYRERKTRITEPKTKTSVRIVPLPEAVQAAFIDHAKRHRAEMEKNDYLTQYVFTTSSGAWIDRKNFRTAWRRHLRACNVEYLKFHACRATYCTLLCKKGVLLETAARLMGHSDISVTASFYRMVSDQELISASNQLNDLFQKPGGDILAITDNDIKK